MKQLGFQSNVRKKRNRLKDYIVPLEVEDKLNEFQESCLKNKSNEINIKEDNSHFDGFNFSKVLNQRRYSLQVPELPKSESRRKFSLDSSNLQFSKNAFNTAQSDKIKNKNGLNNVAEENHLELKSLYSDSFLKSDLDLYQKPSQAYSARTQYSVRSNFTNPTTLSNLSNMTANASQRSSSYLPSSSTRLPKIKKKNEEEKKRQVSFGKVELNQLDIPTLYRHSNVAMEKFKLDPYFYLPNGNLKRKFSLPKLDETLEAIRNCRYIRKHKDEMEENIDVTDIFKDIFPNGILSTNFESSFVNEDDII